MYKQKIGHKDHVVGQATRNDLDRFMNRITEKKGCWLYDRPNKYGYGVFYVKNIPLVAHRFAKIHFDGLPNGFQYACHVCTNKNCVNPQHLVWQTPKQNSFDKKRDRTGRERLPRGEDAYQAKLTTSQVQQIWKLYHLDLMGSVSISRQFKVTKAAIISIVRRKSWTHVTANLRQRPIPSDGVTSKRGSQHYATSLTDTDVLEIRRRMKLGEMHSSLSRDFGISMGTLTAIRQCKTWKHLLPTDKQQRHAVIAGLARK